MGACELESGDAVVARSRLEDNDWHSPEPPANTQMEDLIYPRRRQQPSGIGAGRHWPGRHRC